MKEKIICFLLTLVIFCMAILNTGVIAEAFDVNTTISNIESSGGDAGDASTAAKKVLGASITLIQVVGTGVAIIILTYVAIKYMTAAPNEKAEFKKSATGYIVGAVVLFAASNIVKIIADFSTSNITT